MILEFPRQVIKNSPKEPNRSEDLLKQFARLASETGIRNVAFLCSAIRSVQKKQNFRLYKPAQIAVFIAKDSTYATFCSAIGFATLGGGYGWQADNQKVNQIQLGVISALTHKSRCKIQLQALLTCSKKPNIF